MVLGLTKKMAFADQFAKVANGYFANVAAHPGALAGVERRVRLRHCRSISISPAIPTWRSAWRSCSAFISRSISGALTWLAASRISGGAGTSRSPAGCATICTFRSAAAAAAAWLTYRNLMLTMLLGGLWHGASWNFVIWGGYHGALLAIERALSGERPPADEWNWTYPIRASLTFVLALIGWVFFRAADLPQSVQVLRQMIGGGRAGAAGALAFRPGGPGLDSRGRGGKIGVVRAGGPCAYAGLRVRAGRGVVLPGNLRRAGCSHSLCLLPVLAPDGRRGMHHRKQQTNHHENCETRCDDHKRYPTPTHPIAIEGPFCYHRFSSEIPAAEHVTPRQNCPTAVSDVSELRAASIISDTCFPER